MDLTVNNGIFVPHFVPQKMNRKFTYKVVIKKDYQRADDNCCALYLRMYKDKKQKRLPFGIAVLLKDFDEVKTHE